MEPKTSGVSAGTIRNLLNGLILLQSHLRLYGARNANVRQTSDRLLRFLEQQFAATEEVTLYVAGQGFLLENGFIDRSNESFAKFANRLFLHGIASLSLCRGISAQEIHDFLSLVSRKPAETWEEGGIEKCLHRRGIGHLTVREMDEGDLLLVDEMSDADRNRSQAGGSALWEDFARSLLHGLHLGSTGESSDLLSPAALAERIGEFLQQSAAEVKQGLIREAGRFLASLAHEKMRIYRAAALSDLVSFVNGLPPDLCRMFLENAFHLHLDADLSEGLLRGLSDRVVLDAFRNATVGSAYTPPVVLKLLGRIARERELIDPASLPSADAEPEAATAKIGELFRGDDFDKYVPKAYQGALLGIVRAEGLPAATTAALEELKRTLEPHAVEHHLGEILLDILRTPPDLKHLDGLRSNLRGTLDFYLGIRSYRMIRMLYERCRSEEAGDVFAAEVDEILGSPRFVSTALDDLRLLDREQSGVLWELIYALKEPFVEPLLDRLGTETDRSLRQSYLKALVKFGHLSVAPAVARLADQRWYVLRNMLCLLYELGDPAALPEIRACLSHPHPKVRQEALRTCLALKDERAASVLLTALGAKSAAELIPAINLAGLTRDPRVVARLLELLQGGTLFDYQTEVKRAAVRALGINASVECLPVFARILGAHSLLHAGAHDLLKREIVASLERFPIGAVREMLQAQARSGSAELSRAARATLKKLEGGGR